MQKLEEPKQMRKERTSPLLPVTAIVAVRNEARNLPRCLESLREMGEVYVVDSQSLDSTVQIAESYGEGRTGNKMSRAASKSRFSD